MPTYFFSERIPITGNSGDSRIVKDVEAMTNPNPITVMYKNYRGEIRRRTMQPLHIWYGTTQWHPTPQWFVKAIDLDTSEERDFALGDFLGEVP